MKRSWEQIISSQESSGLNIKRFCEQQGISPTLFHYHKKRLRKASSSGFIEVSGGFEDASWMEISYPNGVRLKLRGNVSFDQLKRLLHV
jgi:hypothetical protein